MIGLWDGVMADNDVYDDYYGLCPPIEGGRTLADFRSALDEFVPLVGASLNAVGKLLIPNIAESRRDPGRWARHAAYGGGFEEVWLAHGPDDYFDVRTVLAQAAQAPGPGITIMRVASDGTDIHPNVTHGWPRFVAPYIPHCSIYPRVGGVLAIIEAFGGDAERDLDAVPGPLGDAGLSPVKVPLVVTRARASACEASCAPVRSVRLTPAVLAGQRATSTPRTG
jgi:hypothetical protein